MKRENNKNSKKETESEQKPDMSGAQYDVCNRAVLLHCINKYRLCISGSSFDDMVDMVEVEEDSAAADTSEDTGDDLGTIVNFGIGIGRGFGRNIQRI